MNWIEESEDPMIYVTFHGPCDLSWQLTLSGKRVSIFDNNVTSSQATTEVKQPGWLLDFFCLLYDLLRVREFDSPLDWGVSNRMKCMLEKHNYNMAKQTLSSRKSSHDCNGLHNYILGLKRRNETLNGLVTIQFIWKNDCLSNMTWDGGLDFTSHALYLIAVANRVV